METEKPLKLKHVLILAVTGLGLYVGYVFYDRLTVLENRVAVLDVIRTGEPIEYFDDHILRLKPRKKIKIAYDGRTAELRYYRSSGIGPVKSSDFVLIVDGKGIVVAAFRITSQTHHSKLMKRLGVGETDVPYGF